MLTKHFQTITEVIITLQWKGYTVYLANLFTNRIIFYLHRNIVHFRICFSAHRWWQGESPCWLACGQLGATLLFPPLAYHLFLQSTSYSLWISVFAYPLVQTLVCPSLSSSHFWEAVFPSPILWAPGKAALPLLFSSELSSLQGHSFPFSLCVLSPPCRFVAVTGVGEGHWGPWLKIISRAELQLRLHKSVSCAVHCSSISPWVAVNPTFGPK